MAFRLPPRIARDPAFALAPIEARVVYAVIHNRTEIRPCDGDGLVETLATLCQDLGADALSLVERAIPVMVRRGLCAQEGDVLRPKHAPPPRVGRFIRPPTWPDSQWAAWRKHLSRARADDDRRTETEIASGWTWNPRGHASKPAAAAPAAPAGSAPAVPVTESRVTAVVTSPVTASGTLDAVTQPVVGTLLGGGLGEERESLSLSPSESQIIETSTVTRAREADPPAAPIVTGPTLVTADAFCDSDAPSPELLVATLRRNAEGRVGSASPEGERSLGQRLVELGVTVERAQTMGELAKSRSLYMQDKHPVFPVGLLVGRRGEDAPILASWNDAVTVELKRRARDAADRQRAATPRAPAPVPPANAAGPPAPRPGPHRPELPPHLEERLRAKKTRAG